MLNKKNPHFLFIAVCFSLFVILSFIINKPVDAQEEKEPIIVNGDKVEYLYDQKKVVGVNNVVITYKDLLITCDKIAVDMQNKEAIAEGNVVMTQKDSVVRGEKVHYSFETEKGTIIQAEVRREPWYGKGESGSKVDKEEFAIDRGYLTTCDLPHPHYRIQARRVKLFVDDRVEAHHVIFFLGELPVFYFPLYIHPLADKRPRVTIVPGRNSRWGYYVLTAWRYYLHEWSRGYIHIDWREKKGFAEGLDYKYKLGYFGKGLARFYYTRESHVTTGEETETGQSVGEDRWRIQLRHKWQVDKDTLAMGEFHKLSDKLFIKDYFFLDEYDNESQPITYFSLIRTKPNYNLSMYFRVRTQDFFTEVEKLPELKMDVKSQRLRETNFYYKSTNSFALLQKKYEDTIYEREKLRAGRFDTDHEMSYLANLFGFLTFNPYAGIKETWYSEDAHGNKNELRYVYTLGTRFSTKFYRVFQAQTDALGLDINDLKHIITPSIDYRYTPTPNIKAADLKQFDEVDSIASHHGIALSVVNRLQTKRGNDKEIVNLARFETSTEVLIKPENGKSLDDVRLDLELTPYSWLRIDADTTYDPKELNIKTVNTDIVAEKKDLWRVGLGYRFEDGRLQGTSNQVTADFFYKISPKWNIKAYHRYKKNPDRNNFELEEQNYAIERDLHCWLAEFNYQLKKTDGLEVDLEHRVWLVMRIKAFPEIPFRMFSTKYSGPRAGVSSEQPE